MLFTHGLVAREHKQQEVENLSMGCLGHLEGDSRLQVENLLWDLLGLCNAEGRFSRGNDGFLGHSDPKV